MKKLDRTNSEKSHLLSAEKRIFHSLTGSEHEDEYFKIGGDTSVPFHSLGTEKEEERRTHVELPKHRTLGTFSGVFAPVCLSMLSSILFLRVGYIVGNAGILETGLQLLIAYGILISTVLSICAIATNGAVEGGGVYYMISRTLGPEFGGSIGTLFYFANVVSSALYLSACTEGVVNNFGPMGSISQTLPTGFWWNFIYATIFNTLNLFICIFGSKVFGRTTAAILTAVVICTVVTFGSFFQNVQMIQVYEDPCYDVINKTKIENCTRSINGTFEGLLWSSHHNSSIMSLLNQNLYPKYVRDCSADDPSDVQLNFFIVFGVLFSGVTGIMSGANMSGELIAPSKSIPKGTLGACFFTLSILSLVSLLTAMTCETTILLHDCNFMSSLSVWPPIIAIGVLLATFSASLNNLIGASRVLEAVAKDVLFGPFLDFINKGVIHENPVAAVMSTWLFVQIFLLMGTLNKIAQLSSVLFLLSYATVNLACLGLHLASAPNFRPSFKFFSWHTCFIGLVGTSTMMFFISPMFSAVSILLCFSLILALNFFSPVRNSNSWGSISQALLFHQVRKYLLLLDPRKDHVKFWRPQMLLLVNNPRTSCALIDFVNTLKKGGLYVIGHVEIGVMESLDYDPCSNIYAGWLRLIDYLKIKAFIELTVATSLREGVHQLVRISGIGAMKPNTIVLGFRDSTFHGDDFLSPLSPYTTLQFEGIFPNVRQKNEQTSANNFYYSEFSQNQSVEADRLYKDDERISKMEFVGIILDVLKLRKNICVCRHFQNLNKSSLFNDGRGSSSIFGTNARKKLYLDVWLVDFFSPSQTNVTDTTSLFILQLACIVNRVTRWKKLSIRVFVAARDNNYGGSNDDDIGSNGTDLEGNAIHSTSNSSNTEELLAHMLELLRIKATTHILNWVPKNKNQNEAFYGHQVNDNLEGLTTAFLKSACETVRRRSTETAVTFLYLPAPPSGKEEYYVKYLDALTSLTDNWPPTLMVRGVSPVTSTTL